MKKYFVAAMLMTVSSVFAAEVSTQGNRADVAAVFKGEVSKIVMKVETSTGVVMLSDDSCGGIILGGDAEGGTPIPDAGHADKIYPGHHDGCKKSSLVISFDLKNEADKTLFDFFSHVHGSVRVAMTAGKITTVVEEKHHHHNGHPYYQIPVTP